MSRQRTEPARPGPDPSTVSVDLPGECRESPEAEYARIVYCDRDDCTRFREALLRSENKGAENQQLSAIIAELNDGLVAYEKELAALRKVAELVLAANAADWKATTDEEADIAWGNAIQAAREALESSSKEPK